LVRDVRDVRVVERRRRVVGGIYRGVRGRRGKEAGEGRVRVRGVGEDKGGTDGGEGMGGKVKGEERRTMSCKAMRRSSGDS
jgi:hypothetical protein